MTTTRTMARLGVAVMTGLALAGAPVASAVADPGTAAAPAAEGGGASIMWFGNAHVTVNSSTRFGGWVDGNGPDSYFAYVYCSGGAYRTGVTRWAGDRRGSFATCPSGQTKTGNYGFRLIDV